MYEQAQTDPCEAEVDSALAEAETEASEERGEQPKEKTSPTSAPLDPPSAAELSDPLDQEPLADDHGLESLRQRVTEPEQALPARSPSRHMEDDCAEFAELYPNVSPDSLPDDVWENVRRGIPLAAAYALSNRRRERIAQLAAERNAINRARSTGAVTVAPTGYYSPEEVRAMNAAEVRRNYNEILLSMQKWR